MPATRSCVALRPKHDRWVNQSTPKYSTLPKFGFDVCAVHPDPAKRGGRTSSRAAGRAAVDVSSAVADASCRVGQWIEPSPVSDLQAALYERRFILAGLLGRNRNCLRTAKPCGPGRRRYGQALRRRHWRQPARCRRILQARGRPERTRLPGEHGRSRPTTAQGRPCVRLHLYAAVRSLCATFSRSRPRVPAGTRPSLRPFH